MATAKKINYKDYVDPAYLLKESKNEDVNLRNHENWYELGKMGYKCVPVSGHDTIHFDPNVFSAYMCEAMIAVRDESDNIYLYNRKKGVYVKAKDWMLQILCKQLMNQIMNRWSLNYERLGVESFRRDVNEIVSEFRSSRYINLKNGILDIDKNKLLKHTPKLRSLSQLNIKYQKDAKCPQFEKFIEDITGGDDELATVLQEIVGYCLCQSTKAEKAFFFYGGGRNGKSVLSGVMERLVGKRNVSHVKLSELNGNFGLHPMLNKTLNVAAENHFSGKFNPDRLKEIASGDSINVNIKYQDAVSSAMYCKLVFMANTLPPVSDYSYGFFRKLMIVPFNVTIKEPDVDLRDKLKMELPGILNWALVGLRRLKKNHYQFSHCEAIESRTREYYEQQNPTGQFFFETYREDPNGKIVKSEIYSDYCVWAQNAGLDPENRNAFWNMLKKKAEEPDSKMKLVETKDSKNRYIKGYSRIYPKQGLTYTIGE